MLLAAAVVPLAAGLLGPSAALGQLTGDSVPRLRILPSRLSTKNEMDTASFRLGPVRFTPELSITDAGYDSNVLGSPLGEETSDYTFSLTGGIRWIIPAGSKFYVVGNANPAYTWYDKLSDRRFFGGRYSTYLLGFFNRLTLELGGFSSKDLSYITSDAQLPVIQTTLDGSLRVEVDVASNFALYTKGRVERLRFGSAGGEFVDTRDLPRTEGSVEAGFRYRFTSTVDMTASYQKTQTKFENFGDLNDNQSDAYSLGIHYNREKFYVNVNAGYRVGKALNGSSFQDYSTPTGGFFLSYFPARLLEFQAYGDRRISYSIATSRFIYSRYGGALNYQARENLTLRAYGTYGTNQFSASGEGTSFVPEHTDRSVDYGGGFSTTLFHRLVWSVTASESRYLAELPGASDSKVVRVLTTLSFDKVFGRRQ